MVVGDWRMVLNCLEGEPNTTHFETALHLARETGAEDECYEEMGKLGVVSLLSDEVKGLDLSPEDAAWTVGVGAGSKEEVLCSLLTEYASEEAHPRRVRLARVLELEEEVRHSIPRVGDVAMALLASNGNISLRDSLAKELEMVETVVLATGEVPSGWMAPLLDAFPTVTHLQEARFADVAPLLVGKAEEVDVIKELYARGKGLRQDAFDLGVDLRVVDVLEAEGHNSGEGVKDEVLQKVDDRELRVEMLRLLYGLRDHPTQTKLAERRKVRGKVCDAAGKLHITERALWAGETERALLELQIVRLLLTGSRGEGEGGEELAWNEQRHLRGVWREAAEKLRKPIALIAEALTQAGALRRGFYTRDTSLEPPMVLLGELPCAARVKTESRKGSFALLHGEGDEELVRHIKASGYTNAVHSLCDGFRAKAKSYVLEASGDIREGVWVEVALQPTVTFEVPREALVLSPEAVKRARCIEETPGLAAAFLDDFGDHVSIGRHSFGEVTVKAVAVKLGEGLEAKEVRRALEECSKEGTAEKRTFETGGSEVRVTRRTADYSVGREGGALVDRGDPVPVWEVLEGAGYTKAAEAVLNAFETRTVVAKVPRHVADAVGRHLGEAAPAPRLADGFVELVEGYLQRSRGSAHRTAQALADTVNFACQMQEAVGKEDKGLPFIAVLAGVGAFSELVGRVVEGDEHRAGKRLVRRVFDDPSMQRYVQDVPGMAPWKERIEEFLSTPVGSGVPPVAVPLDELPGELEENAESGVSSGELVRTVAGLLGATLKAGVSKRVDGLLEVAADYGYQAESQQFGLEVGFEGVKEMARRMRSSLTSGKYCGGEQVQVEAEGGGYHFGRVVREVGGPEEEDIVRVEVEREGVDGTEVVPVWRVEAVEAKRDKVEHAVLGQDGPRKAATHAITMGGERRIAIDRPMRDLGDALRLRLGLLREQRVEERTEDDFEWGDEGGEELPGESEGKAKASTADVVELMRECDPYDTHRVAQHLSEMDTLVPVYFRREGERTEHYLHTATLRYVEKRVEDEESAAEGGRPKKVMRTVVVAEDVTLPRVAFVSLHNENGNKRGCPTAELLRHLFGCTVPGHDAREGEKGSLSIEVGVQALLLPDGTGGAKERRNWIVHHVKGEIETVFGDGTALGVLENVDVVVVEGCEGVEAIRERTGRERVFTWHAEGRLEVRGKDRHIAGEPGTVAPTVRNKILLNVKQGLRTKQPLLRIAGEGSDPLLRFLEKVEETVRTRRPTKGTYRTRKLQQTQLHTEQQLLRRDLVHGRLREGWDRVRELERQRHQKAWGSRPAPVMVLLAVLRRKTRAERLLGVEELARALDRADQAALEDEVEAVRRAREQMDRAGMSDNTARERWTKARLELNKQRTGIEHVWRELGHLYAAAPECFKDAPWLAGRFLRDGGILEVVDGDGGGVNTVWLEKVLKHLHEGLRTELGHEARVLVESVVGVQSCGKSTLQNALFGCGMRTAEGACTRGINATLVRTELGGEKYDYVLLLDTEGICNPLFKGEAWYDWHNNWIATLSILAADACLLMSNNEDHTVVEDVLPFALLCHHNAKRTLQEVGFSRRALFFVFNRINPVGAETHLEENRAALVESLERNKQLLGAMEKEGAGGRGEVFDLVDDGDFVYLGPVLNEPEGYGRQVEHLRERMAARTRTADWQGGTLEKWWSLFTTLLSSLENMDSMLSFATVMRLQTAQVRREAIGEQEREVAAAWREAFMRVQSQVSLDSMERAADSKVERKDTSLYRRMLMEDSTLREREKKATAEVERVLEDPQHRGARDDDLGAWKRLLAETETWYRQELMRVCDNTSKAVEGEHAMARRLEHTLRNLVQDSTHRLLLQSSEELARDTFHKVFRETLSECYGTYPPFYVVPEVVKMWPQSRKASTGARIMRWVSNVVTGRRNEAEVQSVVDRVWKLLQEFGEAKPTPFDRNRVRQCVSVIKTASLDEATKSNVSAMLLEDVCAMLQWVQTKWEEENNPYVRLKRREEEFFGRFKVLCRGLSRVVEAEEMFLITLWNKAIPGYCKHKALELHAESVRDCRWISDVQQLLAHVNLDIIDKLSATGLGRWCYLAHSSTIEGLRLLNSSSHMSKVQEKLMLQSVRQGPQQEHQSRKEEVVSTFRALVAKVRDALSTKGKTEGPLRGKDFAKLLVSTLPVGLTIEHSALEVLSSVEEIDGLHFAKRMVDEVSKGWEQSTTPVAVSWAEVKQQLPSTCRGLKARCGEVCPRCKAPCYREEGHTDLHDAYHQPEGLVGVRYHETDELMETSCSESVSKNYYIIYSDERREPYRDFERLFPGWKLPELAVPEKYKPNALFRQSVFANYQTQLAAMYGRKENTKDLPGEAIPSLKQALLRIVS
eukprot:Sspe_Gene.45825::Locus_22758_Transcript_1_2_Confidence_0.400_Length_7216::g.45825::m.45825